MGDTRTFAPQVYDYERVAVDPVTFEVVHHRLISISEEQAATLSAISGSPLVNDASDFNTGIFRARGEIATMGKTVLFHAASVAEMIKHIIEDCSVNPGIRPGDMFLVNNPYKGALHQPDFGMVAPAFHDGKLYAWIGVCAHQLDVGGAMGAAATEVYQEGMLISPVRVVENDEIRSDIMSVVLGMSRMSQNLALDFRGMIAANRVALRRLEETIAQYGIDTVLSVIDGAIDAAERAVRARLAELPDGVYRSQKYLDHDGYENRLYRIHVEATKTGDRLTLDFSKSADQVARFMNCTESGLLAGLRAGLLPILAYDLPWNEGVFRPMEVIARPGSMVSAKFPAPVSQGPLGAMWIVEMVVTEALSLMVATHPRYIAEAQAAPNGGPDGFNVTGTNQHGERTAGSTLDQIYVGGGAYHDHDGLSPQGHRHIPAIRLQNVERNESHAPLLYLYRKFIPDTGGPGRYRGGVSVGHAYLLHQVKMMQAHFACHCYESPISTGLFGGYPAACNTRRLLRHSSARRMLESGRIPYDTAAIEGQFEPLPAKVRGAVDFSDQDFHECAPSAGGGWGDPVERDPALVAEDVRWNAVSREMASEAYGVVIDEDGSVDAAATGARRAAIRAQRLSWPRHKTLESPPALLSGGAETLSLWGDRAKIERMAGGAYLVCDCGHAIAPANENWKLYARRASATAAQLGPRIAMHAELEAVRYACPACARLHWVEVKRKDEEPLFDMEIFHA
ncbi:MAG: hydantoinase B/oxoprolinase family protein [Burkholderiales bacterium]|nr:hydantoinase B/oxoprolinase family protein [Burkholderiales bacterium]